MTGNCHVRFWGGLGLETAPGYPIYMTRDCRDQGDPGDQASEQELPGGQLPFLQAIVVDVGIDGAADAEEDPCHGAEEWEYEETHR